MEKQFYGFNTYMENNEIYVDTACGCYGCDNGVEQGHYMCSNPDGVMLEAEKRGEVVRAFVGRWVWILTRKGEEVLYPSVFIKRVRKQNTVEYRIIKGEKGFGKVLFSVNGYDNPVAESQMKDAIEREIEEKGYYVAGDNYSEKE